MKKRNAVFIERFLDNTLQLKQYEEIQHLIQNDPAFRKEFVRALRIKGLIQSVESKQQHEEEIERVVMNAVGGKLSRRFESRVMRRVKSRDSVRRPPVCSNDRHSSGRFFRYAALLMVGILVAAYFISVQRSGPSPIICTPRMIECQGRVTIERNGRIFSAEKNMPIYFNDRIQTDSASNAVITCTKADVRVEIASKTHLQLTDRNQRMGIDVQTGKVDLSVHKQDDGDAIQVTTPHANVDVVGTIFSVNVSDRLMHKNTQTKKTESSDSEISNLKSEIPRTRVETYEGEVRVLRKSDQNSITLTAGQYVSVNDSKSPTLAASKISGWVGIRISPNGEILKEYKWRFDTGISNGFQMKGRAEWKDKKETGYHRSGVCMAGKSLAVIPYAFQIGKPVRITYNASILGNNMIFYGSIVLNNTEKRAWIHKSFNPLRKQNFRHTLWVRGSRQLELNEGIKEYKGFQSAKCAIEYTFPAEEIWMVLSAINICIHEIHITESSADELPPPLQSDKAWKDLIMSMKWFDSQKNGKRQDRIPNPLKKDAE
mgnify:CR=1 FL=1